MDFLDGSGSFGLGLGGFDVSDFMGFTGDGGFGSMTFDTPDIGNMNSLNLAEDNINRITDGGAFDATKSNGLATLPSPIKSPVGSPKDGNGNDGGFLGGSALEWVGLANSLYKDWDQRDYRDDVYNVAIKDKNDQLAGQKQLVNTYYGVDKDDSAATASEKSNNNPTLTRSSYATR